MSIERKKLLTAVLISVLLFGAATLLVGLFWGLLLLGDAGLVILVILMIALLAWVVYER